MDMLTHKDLSVMYDQQYITEMEDPNRTDALDRFYKSGDSRDNKYVGQDGRRRKVRYRAARMRAEKRHIDMVNNRENNKRERQKKMAPRELKKWDGVSPLKYNDINTARQYLEKKSRGLGENYVYATEEEALYEDYLVESTANFEIDAHSNYLAENFDTDTLDYIFSLVEDLQNYLVEFFDFENENEINEVILSLSEESIYEILEDMEYGEGIEEDTFLDISETVNAVFDSSDIIVESIIKENYDEDYQVDQDDYEYVMEQAAILSTLKVATMLSEAEWLNNIARAAGGIAGRAYGRHVNAMKDLDAYNKERRKVLDKWNSERKDTSTPSTRQTADTTAGVKPAPRQSRAFTGNRSARQNTPGKSRKGRRPNSSPSRVEYEKPVSQPLDPMSKSGTRRLGGAAKTTKRSADMNKALKQGKPVFLSYKNKK